MHRRRRKQDDLATPDAIRAVLDELKMLFPALSGFSSRKLKRLLLAVRHFETYPATETNRGRPANFNREMIAGTDRQLKAILERLTGDRISIQTFIGHYLPILDWPDNVVAALVRGDLSRLEAAQVARITADRIGVKEREAVKIREEIIAGHIRSRGSLTALREKVREALGELTIVTSEKMTEAVERVDDLLRVDPGDRRHLFYEQMKDFFFALREIQPDEIDDATLEQLVLRGDALTEVIYSILRRRKLKERSAQKFRV